MTAINELRPRARLSHHLGMGWNLSTDVHEFLAEAGRFLRADPVEHTVQLVATATLVERGTHAFGDHEPLFGWWRPDSAGAGVGAVAVRTGSYPLLLTRMPEPAAGLLAGLVADRQPSLQEVSGPAETAYAFGAVWEGHSGAAGEITLRQRLYRLDGLAAPDPQPPGAARVATGDDRDLVMSWGEAFHQDVFGAGAVNRALVDDRLGYGGLVLWEADETPVAMAAHTRVVAGVARIVSVYTPPERRGKGFGSAVTAAATRAAIGSGAGDIVLFTDLANPTSNAIYQRIGFRPVSDRITLNLRLAER